MEAEARRERRRRQREQVVNCCKTTIAFIFSHIGLSVTVVAYALAGGLLFQAIEGRNEIDEMMNASFHIMKFKHEKANLTYNLALDVSANQLSCDNFTNQIVAHYDEFQRLLQELVVYNAWDWRKTTDDKINIKWSLASSLLFSVTLITTIGKIDRSIIALSWNIQVNYINILNYAYYIYTVAYLGGGAFGDAPPPPFGL